jgi:multisubunit Na+/H+ antiporter MnhG subunit
MDMSAAGYLEALLLIAGVAVLLLCCGGLFAGDVFDRLHYLGPATVLAPSLIAGAVLVSSSSAESLIKSILLALSLALSSPVLTHATARAGFTRKKIRDKAPLRDSGK